MPTKRLKWAERFAAFFSYFPLFLPFSGLTLLILNRKNLVVRFVAMQSIIIWPVYIVTNFVLNAIPLVGLLLSSSLLLALIVLSIVGFFGVSPRLRWIATLADKTLTGLTLPRATFFHRFLAWFINTFIAFAAISMVCLLVWIGMSMYGASQEVQLNVLTLVFLVVTIGVWVVNTVLMIRSGADLGKRFLGLRVVTNESESVSVGRVLVRETVGKLVSGILFVGYFWVLIDKERQSWHDKLAKTIVVYEGR